MVGVEKTIIRRLRCYAYPRTPLALKMSVGHYEEQIYSVKGWGQEDLLFSQYKHVLSHGRLGGITFVHKVTR